MYIECHQCGIPIHYINIIPSPDRTINTSILSLSGVNLENLWGADIKCQCGHKNTGIILESREGITIAQKEYKVIK